MPSDVAAIGILRQRRLHRLLGAGLISLTGDWILRIGLAYRVYVLTGSTVASALLLLASYLPQVILGSPPGSSSTAGTADGRWSWPTCCSQPACFRCLSSRPFGPRASG
jgi:hypothetical protein